MIKKTIFWIITLMLLALFIWSIAEAIKWVVSLDPGISGTVITAIAGIIGLLYTQWHSKSREISEGHRPNKIEVYNTFFDITEKFLNENRNTSSEKIDIGNIPDELEEKFTSLNRGMIIWASPKVIRAWLKFREKARDGGDKKVILYMDDILQAIRADLGNSNYLLQRGDVVKLYLSNPAEIDEIKTIKN